MAEPTPPDLGLLRRQLAAARQDLEGLKGPSHATTTPSMDIAGERELVDQKIALAEARIDTKFARMDGKLDTLLTEIRGARADAKANRNVVATTMVGSALALAALVLAMLSFGATEFVNGTALRDLVAHIVHVRPISSPR